MYYVYEWYVVETGEIIYVGKGTGKRYKVKKHNKFFNDFIRRYNCSSRIIKEFENEKDAFSCEYDRVRELKEKGQCVCNIYGGGQGGTTEWWTDEMRARYSEHNVMKSQKQKERMSRENPMKNKDVSKRVHSQKCKKICIGDEVYESIVAVAKKYNIYDTAIQFWLQRGYSSDGKPCYYFGSEKPEVILKTHNTNSILVFVDGVAFSSLKEAAKYIGVTSSAISYALKHGNGICKGHICRYDNQQPSQGNADKSTLEGSTTNG